MHLVAFGYVLPLLTGSDAIIRMVLVPTFICLVACASCGQHADSAWSWNRILVRAEESRLHGGRSEQDEDMRRHEQRALP